MRQLKTFANLNYIMWHYGHGAQRQRTNANQAHNTHYIK
jgi:hypothetical protein